MKYAATNPPGCDVGNINRPPECGQADRADFIEPRIGVEARPVEVYPSVAGIKRRRVAGIAKKRNC